MQSSFDAIIVVTHAGIGKKITKEECFAALPVELDVPRLHFDFSFPDLELETLYSSPFEQLALEQQRKFTTQIGPELEKYPNALVAYFGLAPIPLAFHLGFLFKGFRNFWIYLFHHDKKVWYRDIEPVSGINTEFEPLELPTHVEKGKGDVFIRISTSYRIEPQHTHEVLSNPTNEFDIKLVNTHPDSIHSKEQIQDLVEKFQEVLSAVANFLPDRDKIHLFLSTSAGIPFALGTKINPTIFPYIQTYQFGKDESPKYREAILISRFSDDEQAFTTAEIKNADVLRRKWSKELKERIIPFIGLADTERSWLEALLKNPETQCSELWKTLPGLHMTSLKNDLIDLKQKTIISGFKYDHENSAWLLDDGFFIAINRRFQKNKKANALQAGRLFLFHEALHYSPFGHNLTEEIATGIGRFPKVIEEADYQADVWAMLNDYTFARHYADDTAINNPKKYFIEAIYSAVETMWSFLDRGVELREIPIRSVNRFLNWYWQSVRIEQLPGNGTLEGIVEILLDKPIIEFAGAEIITLNQRTCFKLAAKPVNQLELAAFSKNRVFRFSPTQITNIVDGFKGLDGSKILMALKSFYASLR
jgi:hypothetical protein